MGNLGKKRGENCINGEKNREKWDKNEEKWDKNEINGIKRGNSG